MCINVRVTADGQIPAASWSIVLQVPTTVMAMVDSSVGGKTGVNHPLGKNMIGAFYQPRLVQIDVETLSTLPKRELASGISEIVKYGLIRDPELFAWLEQNMDKLLARDTAVSLSPALPCACALCVPSQSQVSVSPLWHVRPLVSGALPIRMPECMACRWGHVDSAAHSEKRVTAGHDVRYREVLRQQS